MMAERDPQETLTAESRQVDPTPSEAEAVARTADPRRKKVLLGLGAGFVVGGGGWYMFDDTGEGSTGHAYVGAGSARALRKITLRWRFVAKGERVYS